MDYIMTTQAANICKNTLFEKMLRLIWEEGMSEVRTYGRRQLLLIDIRWMKSVHMDTNKHKTGTQNFLSLLSFDM